MGLDLFWTYAGPASGFPVASAIVRSRQFVATHLLEEKNGRLAKRVYLKCYPRPRLFGIGRRVLAECADRSPPPNGGANPRTRVGAARQIVVDLQQ